MTTTLRASAIAAKGHYYGLSELASNAIPVIVDSTGSAIEASAANDDTYLGVERYTGVTLISKERLFFNMVLQNDQLFQNFSPSKESTSEYGYFFPLAYRSREMVWSQSQVEDTFSALITLEKCKWIFLSILLFLGLVALALSTFCCCKYRRLVQWQKPLSAA